MAPSTITRARNLLTGRGNGRSADPDQPVRGVVRLGARTKELVKHLSTGEIAVIDHADLDPIAAEDLVACGVAAVVNVAPSMTGRYPNAGPLVLTEAGVRLIDAPGVPLFDRLSDGDEVEIVGGEIRRGDEVVGDGRELSHDELLKRLAGLRKRVDAALADFAENTMRHVRDEGELLGGRLELPPIRTSFRDRQALIVVRGTDHRKDLRALNAYIRDVRPVLIGVDGGADAIVEAGLKPDVVLGDMDSAIDATLSSGAELIVHGYPDGRAPGRDRLERLGLDYTVVPAAGTSQDIAMLLASERGAELIVMVGSHFNLEEFLGKDRGGMSSTFLARLRVGEKLVDAKGVSRLYRPGASLTQMSLVFAAFMVTLVIVISASPALDNLLELIWLKVQVLLGL